MKQSKINYEYPIYQKKSNGRYQEVGKYLDFDCYNHGAHLLIVNQGGGTSYLHNVEIEKAGMLAAMKLAKEAMVKAFMEASDLRPAKEPVKITQEQRELLDKLKATGFFSEVWIRESAQGIVDAAFEALEKYDENKTID